MVKRISLCENGKSFWRILMAKSSKNEQEQEGEISVSMFKISIKGSDTSLQKGLDTIRLHLCRRALPPLNNDIFVLTEPGQRCFCPLKRSR
jgi:hypothetical protein